MGMEWWNRFWAALSTFTFCQFYTFARKLPLQDVELNGRRYRVLKQLGEGGYAFVYLVKEQDSGNRFALKRLHCGSGEQLQAARNEIQCMQKLNHPNLLRLLDYLVAENRPSSITAYSDDGYGATHAVWMLFPVYEDGSLQEELATMHAAGQPMSTRVILDIFLQLCMGLHHMHQQGLAHRDMKPHNVLLEKPRNGSTHQTAPLLSQQDVEGGVDAGRYHAVIVDFGSTAAAKRQISSRLEALAAQEDAESNCTAPYRAPELIDVPSECVLDERIDVWSLGCTLYHMMYGASPFQRTMDQGGSLALAVMDCSVPWPKFDRERYPQEMHNLVTYCLTVNPQQRPFVPQVLERCRQLMNHDLKTPQACAKF